MDDPAGAHVGGSRVISTGTGGRNHLATAILAMTNALIGKPRTIELAVVSLGVDAIEAVALSVDLTKGHRVELSVLVAVMVVLAFSL